MRTTQQIDGREGAGGGLYYREQGADVAGTVDLEVPEARFAVLRPDGRGERCVAVALGEEAARRLTDPVVLDARDALVRLRDVFRSLGGPAEGGEAARCAAVADVAVARLEGRQADPLDVLTAREYELAGFRIPDPRRWALEAELSREDVAAVAALDVGGAVELPGAGFVSLVVRRSA